jgi:two-component system, NtrC family, nitrogen regulation sensor histidine kinase GlnL
VLKKILDHLNESILLFDSELTLRYINTAGEILFADSSRHLTGRSAEFLFRNANDTIIQDLQQCLQTNETLIDRELVLDYPHQAITINLSAIPLHEDNVTTEILVELQPVDRHLRISKEEQLLEQHNSTRMLIRGLAHEIKNPLGGLRGAAQLLDMELNDSELTEYTQIIIAESDRLRGLVDRMMGPTKPPDKKLMNVHEALERVRQLVQAETSGQCLIVQNYDPSLPDIHADSDLLIQAFLNIVRNAAQALGPQGQITLKTRISRQMTIGRIRHKLIIKIDVIDNGHGIKAEIMNQIFYPMITGRAEGTGLGLSIAQSIINQHNGLIECSSNPGKTIFSIYLPVENYNGHA